VNLERYLAERREAVDRALDRALPPADLHPSTIHEAMRYSVMAGGKRLRPILVIAGAEAAGGSMDAVMPAACAFEMIHTYSLIHDDLPAMDDDDFRRGRPTSHKMFGEASAMLAGDALLTLAFRLVAENFSEGRRNPALLKEVLIEIADAAGTLGMIGGQVVDLESQGQKVLPETLEYIHIHKTQALIRASLRAGALLANAEPSVLSALTRAGECLGLAFQIVDDILDVEGSLEQLGKSSGSDQRKQKATFPEYFGLEASKLRARTLADEAKAALAGIGPAAEPLVLLSDFIVNRKS
jgi:geranylgeranyl diphosphate synthase type II